MAKAYTFEDLIKRNAKIANTPLSDLYKDNGDEAQGEILDVPSLSRDQAAAQASAAAQAAAKALYTGGQNKTPNTLIPGMTYTEWLTKGGMNGQAQKEYDAAVRAAETDYAKTLALYGQNAETLGRAGLTGSGYTDYLTGAGFSAMQGAKVAAADTKALTEAQQRLSYADYLAGVDAQNAQLAAQAEAQQQLDYENYLAKSAEIKSVIDQMVQSGMDDNSIMAYITQHYGDEFAGYVGDWIGSAHLYLDPILAQQQAADADAQAVQYKQQIYTMLTSGKSAEQVRADMQYVMGLTGADTSQLDAWIAEAQAAAQPTVDALNAEKTAAETEAANARKIESRNILSNGYADGSIFDTASAEQALRDAGRSNEEIAEAMSYLSDVVSRKLTSNISNPGATLADLPSAVAIDQLAHNNMITPEQAAQLKTDAAAKRAELLAEQFKGFAKMDEENASKAAADWRATIDSLSAEDLPDAQRAELYGWLGDALVSGHIESNMPISDLLNEINSIDPDVVGQAAYDGLVEGIFENFKIDKTDVLRDRVYITFNLGKKNNGKDSKQDIVLDVILSKIASQQLGNGKKGDLKVVGDELYVKLSDDGEYWRKVEKVTSASAGEKENADLMYDLLVRYYSSNKTSSNKASTPAANTKTAIK